MSIGRLSPWTGRTGKIGIEPRNAVVPVFGRKTSSTWEIGFDNLGPNFAVLSDRLQ